MLTSGGCPFRGILHVYHTHTHTHIIAPNYDEHTYVISLYAYMFIFVCIIMHTYVGQVLGRDVMIHGCVDVATQGLYCLCFSDMLNHNRLLERNAIIKSRPWRVLGQSRAWQCNV